jgi:hypothetical protein
VSAKLHAATQQQTSSATGLARIQIRRFLAVRKRNQQDQDGAEPWLAAPVEPPLLRLLFCEVIQRFFPAAKM